MNSPTSVMPNSPDATGWISGAAQQHKRGLRLLGEEVKKNLGETGRGVADSTQTGAEGIFIGCVGVVTSVFFLGFASLFFGFVLLAIVAMMHYEVIGPKVFLGAMIGWVAVFVVTMVIALFAILRNPSAIGDYAASVAQGKGKGGSNR